jgi:hypothetical protein
MLPIVTHQKNCAVSCSQQLGNSLFARLQRRAVPQLRTELHRSVEQARHATSRRTWQDAARSGTHLLGHGWAGRRSLQLLEAVLTGCQRRFYI